MTLVDGEPCPMAPGDLILTPTGQWHEHRHDGRDPVMWLDVLDLPLMVYLDVSYVVEGTAQTAHPAQFAYGAGGLAPLACTAGGSTAPIRCCATSGDARATRCRRTRRAVRPSTPVELAYVNPETGGDCLNTLAFTALLLRPGEEIALPRTSAARVFHVVEGTGDVQVGRRRDLVRARRHVLRAGSRDGAAVEPLEPRSGVSRHRRRIAAAAQARRVRAALTPGRR